MKLGLDGKLVIVTGGGAGIGGAISTLLAEEGAIPAILGRSALDPAFEANIRALQPATMFIRTEMTDDGAAEIAGRSRGTPRIANRLLRRVRDFAQVRADGVVHREVAAHALSLYDVDAIGLDRLDRAVLRALVESFGGGPVGLSTLAVAVGEQPDLLNHIVLMTVRQAKGLEFDSVLVVCPDEIIAESPRGLSDLYVAVTRATQRLGVLHTAPLPEVLASLA